MAVQTPVGSSAITRPAFNYVSLTLLAFTLFCLVYLTTQFAVQGSVVLGHKTAFALLLSWIQTCHIWAAKFGNWFNLHEIQGLDAIQPVSPYHLTPLIDHAKSLLVRAVDINSPTIGYTQPSFPFNILPGRVETSCRNLSRYALERCKTDVRTRTQLFITLVVIFGFVALSVILFTILTCMRRIKARRTVGLDSLAGRRMKQTRAPPIPGAKNTRRCNIDGGELLPGQSLDGDVAVEAEEQGINDHDIPVTMDGMTDGWMQWIRQRANMQQLPSNASLKQTQDNLSQPVPPIVAPDTISAPAPRIPSLRLPRPALTTFRKSRGLDPEPPEVSSQSLRGTRKGKGKEKLKVRWDSSV